MKYDSPNMIEVYTDLYLTCKHVIWYSGLLSSSLVVARMWVLIQKKRDWPWIETVEVGFCVERISLCYFLYFSIYLKFLKDV